MANDERRYAQYSDEKTKVGGGAGPDGTDHKHGPHGEVDKATHLQGHADDHHGHVKQDCA